MRRLRAISHDTDEPHPTRKQNLEFASSEVEPEFAGRVVLGVQESHENQRRGTKTHARRKH